MFPVYWLKLRDNRSGADKGWKTAVKKIKIDHLWFGEFHGVCV